MTDPLIPPSESSAISDLMALSHAGVLLRQARESQGLSLESLAGQIKVAASKIQALESGSHEGLTDLALTRALAMTLCRILKIDPAPVLAGLPKPSPISLARSEPREVPFNESRTRLKLNLDGVRGGGVGAWLSPQWLAPAGLILASAVVYFWPQEVRWPAMSTDTPVVSPAASATAAEGMPSASSVASTPDGPTSASPPASLSVDGRATPPPAAPMASMPAIAPPVSMAVASAATPAGIPGTGRVEVSVSQPAWVEVKDGRGNRLLYRTVAPGEAVNLQADAPISVVLGNAQASSVRFQGQPVDVVAATVGNVARLQLK